MNAKAFFVVMLFFRMQNRAKSGSFLEEGGLGFGKMKVGLDRKTQFFRLFL